MCLLCCLSYQSIWCFAQGHCGRSQLFCLYCFFLSSCFYFLWCELLCNAASDWSADTAKQEESVSWHTHTQTMAVWQQGGVCGRLQKVAQYLANTSFTSYANVNLLTHKHVCMSIPVRTLSDMSYPKPSYKPNSNLNTKTKSWPQTALWWSEKRTKCSHCQKITLLCKNVLTFTI